jgi:hypothetical protein
VRRPPAHLAYVAIYCHVSRRTQVQEHDHEDLGWAFRSIERYGHVTRKPSDPDAWRTAIRRMAREAGIAIRTIKHDDGEVFAYRKAMDNHEWQSEYQGAAYEAAVKRGGPDWDEELRNPPLTVVAPPRKRETPLLSSIDDPRGIGDAIPAPYNQPGAAGPYVVERVQEIRWELWGMLSTLDAVEGATAPTERLLPMAIDLLGVVARSEAASADGVDPGNNLFLTPEDS